MENPVTLRCGDYQDKLRQLERRQACSVSLYLARVFTIPSITETVICDTKYEVLELFCDWAKNPTTVVNLNSKCLMKEPWLSNTAAAWILAERLESRDFEKFCMSAFIKNCAFSPFGPWKEIETYARDESPLARFSNHWIAWNVSLLEHVPLEYAGLKAAELAKSVTQYTGDPRDLDKGHWYSSCGDQIGLLCKHHPIDKQQTLDETQQENQPQSRPALSHRPSHQSTRSTSTDSVYVPSRYVCGIHARKENMYRWSSSLLFASCLCINLGLCVEILVHNYEGINTLILSFSIVCVALGVFCGFVPSRVPWYWVCAFADGVVMIINAASCCKVANVSVCSRMGVLTTFVWLSLPISWAHRFVWKKYWY